MCGRGVRAEWREELGEQEGGDENGRYGQEVLASQRRLRLAPVEASARTKY